MYERETENPVTCYTQTSSLRLATFALLTAVVAASSGCTTAVSVGVKLVGSAVDRADVSNLAKKLIGNKSASADEMFGERLDTLRDLNSDRAWLVYPVELDVLGKDRYVVEVADDKIVALTRAEKNSDPKLDIPRALLMEAKVKGKPPAECEAELDLGKPLLTVRSEATGLLSQLFDARLIKELGQPHYCILRYDKDELCKDVEFIGVGASTKKKPIET